MKEIAAALTLVSFFVLYMATHSMTLHTDGFVLLYKEAKNSLGDVINQTAGREMIHKDIYIAKEKGEENVHKNIENKSKENTRSEANPASIEDVEIVSSEPTNSPPYSYATTLAYNAVVLPVISTSTPLIITHKSIGNEPVRAVYMSSWVAGAPSIRKKIVDMIDTTDINAVVIDVKDNTGVLTWEGRAKDIEAFVAQLHSKNIYVIGRVAVFQDPLFVKKHNDLAIHNKNTGDIWRDNKGIPWVDESSIEMWDYIHDIGKTAYAKGFDEINLDYIRFPVDGKLSLMSFPISKERGIKDKVGVMRDFYTYITDALHKDGIKVSADVFGIILVSDLDVPYLGQDFSIALSHFDYVAPMIYPSHYAAGTFGYKNPAANPYPVIFESLQKAVAIADKTASSTHLATSTMRNKIRPWYQDFNMGAIYTKELVKAQVDAGKKVGVESYMMWDPANTYTWSAF